MSTLIGNPTLMFCRRMAERNAQKRLQEARTTWSSLLKAMFTRLGLQTAEATRKQPKKKAKAAGTTNEVDKRCLP